MKAHLSLANIIRTCSASGGNLQSPPECCRMRIDNWDPTTNARALLHKGEKK